MFCAALSASEPWEGLGGAPNDGRVFVGLLAQEVPDSLAAHCRHTVRLRLRPDDAALTEASGGRARQLLSLLPLSLLSFGPR